MRTAPEPSKPSVSSLISGILQDIATLIHKEFTAARLEVVDELQKARSAALLIGLAAGALLIGTILLCFMLVYLLQSLTQLELWICYGIVGGTFAIIGVIVLFAAKQRVSQTRLVPARTVENTKEDARWITSRVKYDVK
jgi:hypothetical protein